MKFVIIVIIIIAIVVVIIRHRGGKVEESTNSLPHSSRPLLVQFGDLRPHHFENHPVWVHCHVIDYGEPWYDDTDEETFRPWNKDLPVDPAVTMFLVKSTLILADGTEMSGFITPQNPNDFEDRPDLGLIQPQVFLSDGKRVQFWFGIRTPTQKEISSFYAALGKSQKEVFPLVFKANEGLAIGIVSGSVPGFCSRGENEKIKVVK